MDIGKDPKVGILGGSFNPIHYGHLLLGHEARVDCDLGRIMFMPYRNDPREPEEEITSVQERMLMVELGLKGNPYFQISMTEMSRDGPSYTVDTLELVAEKNPRWDLHFLIGSDNLKEFHTWKKPGEILELARLYVAKRDENPKKIPVEVKEIIEEKGTDRILFQSEDAAQTNISSTMIRKRARDQKSIEYLVPDEVDDYIQENEIYRESRKF